MKMKFDKAYCIIVLILFSVILTILPASAQETDIVRIELDSEFGNLPQDVVNYYTDFAISPAKTHIAVRFGENIEIWDIHSQVLVAIINDRLGVFSWSPDGNQLATMTFETELHIWDPFSGELVDTVSGIKLRSNGVRALQWYAPNLVTSSAFELVSWELDSTELPKVVKCHPYGSHHWWNPSRTFIATMAGASSSVIRICDDQFETTASFEGYRTVAWHPENLEVATVGIFNTLRVWHIEEGEALWTSKPLESNIIDISWQDGGNIIATAHANGEIQIWERMSINLYRSIGREHVEGLRNIEWHNDQLITSSENLGIQIWDIVR